MCFHSIYRYERFFEDETQEFLNEKKIDHDDFYRACSIVNNPSLCARECKAEAKSQDFKSGMECLKDAKSPRVMHPDHDNESREQSKMREAQGKLMLQMALSSLSYKNFRDLMQDYRAQRNEAAAAAEEMGLF